MDELMKEVSFHFVKQFSWHIGGLLFIDKQVDKNIPLDKEEAINGYSFAKGFSCPWLPFALLRRPTQQRLSAVGNHEPSVSRGRTPGSTGQTTPGCDRN